MTEDTILLLDFGNVLYPIISDEEWMAGIRALIGEVPAEDLIPLFDRFEAGLITEKELIDRVRSMSSRSFTDTQWIEAWNYRLLQMPAEIPPMLRTLAGRYRMFLLSNTNETHRRRFLADIRRDHGDLMETAFERCFYSNDMGCIKPDAAIYQQVQDHLGDIAPDRCLFIDDNAANVQGARNFGWRAELADRPLSGIVRSLGLI